MGNSPDVRVRLSAEGEQAIIAAFRKIQAEADKTGRVGARGLNVLSGAASTLGRLLPGLTFVGAIAGATVLAKRALETADNFVKLNQKTGVAVETLSGYAHGAALAGIDTETLAKGLAKLAKSAQAAAQDAQDLTSPFRALGIEVRTQQGGLRSLDDLLGDVADKFSKMEDGARKSALAQQLFSRSGQNLIPLLNQGRDGLAEMRAEAERLGLVFSTETALAAELFNDNMKRLQGTIQGFVNRELAALLPLLIDISEALLDVSASSETARNTLGQTAAIAFLGSGGILRAFGGTLKDFTTKGGFTGVMTGVVSFRKSFEEEMDKVSEILFRTFSGPPGGKPPKRPGAEPPLIDEGARTRGLNALKALADAELALERGRLDNELALAKAHNTVAEAEDQRRFKEGLSGLEEFFAGRRQIIEAETAKEIALLEQQVEALSTHILQTVARPLAPKEEQAAKDAEVAKLIAERDKVETAIELKRIETQGKLAAAAGDEREAVRKFNVDQLQAEAAIAEAQGRRFDAARAHLDAQIAGLQRLQGESDEDFTGRKRALFDAGKAKIKFDFLESRARAVFVDIESARTAIEALVARGILTQLEGETDLANLEKERLPVLEDIAAQMGEIANKTKDPDQLAAVRDLNDATVELAASAHVLGNRMLQFKKDLREALTNDLANFFARGIDDAKGFGDAMRSLALSVIQSLRQIAAQMLATLIITQLLRAVMGAFGGAGAGGDVTSSGGLGDSLGPGIAGGGLIRGPGTGTSDSIPARLSTGEYVVRAAAVRMPGNLEILKAMNDFNRSSALQVQPLGRVRRYAGGGMVVDGEPGAAGMAGRADLNIGLDEELFVKKLSASREFRRVIVRTVGENSRSIKAILGR